MLYSDPVSDKMLYSNPVSDKISLYDGKGQQVSLVPTIIWWLPAIHHHVSLGQGQPTIITYYNIAPTII